MTGSLALAAVIIENAWSHSLNASASAFWLSAFVASFSASPVAVDFMPLAVPQIIRLAFAMWPNNWPIVRTSLVGWYLYRASGTCAAALVT